MKLTHIDDKNHPTMVNINQKRPTVRSAQARALVRLPTEFQEFLKDGELHTKKGPVFNTAIVAGTMACKNTAHIIPFCHSLNLDHCKLSIIVNEENCIQIDSRVETFHKTGVELEALTAVTVAALTVYDMCKSLGHGIEIENIHLVEKTGGKTNYKKND